MAFARAAPSTGSVPAHNSSRSTSELSSHSFKIEIILTIWDEKVDSESSMLCSSPISANILSNMAISLFSFAGIIIPHMVIKHIMPTVLSATVLPPVFGPVITRVLNSLPRLISIGTTDDLSINGWRAFMMFTLPLLLTEGTIASIL